MQVCRLSFKVHNCDTKHNSFEPKNHEEPLRKQAVSYAFTIAASLDEELNERLFVLLLEPIQRHRQRMAGSAVRDPGLLWLRTPGGGGAALAGHTPSVELGSLSTTPCPKSGSQAAAAPAASLIPPVLQVYVLKIISNL